MNANKMRFSRGTGTLTVRDLNRTADLTRMVEHAPNLRRASDLAYTRGREFDWFWARVGTATLIGTNRWTYEVTEVQWAVSSNKFVTLEDHIFLTGVFNTVEDDDGATGILAPGYEIANIPAGFALKPIRGNPVVKVFPIIADTGLVVWVFTLANALDGSC